MTNLLALATFVVLGGMLIFIILAASFGPDGGDSTNKLP